MHYHQSCYDHFPHNKILRIILLTNLAASFVELALRHYYTSLPAQGQGPGL